MFFIKKMGTKCGCGEAKDEPVRPQNNNGKAIITPPSNRYSNPPSTKPLIGRINDGSYAFSGAKIRDQTPINEDIIRESDFQKMAKYYCNLLTKMGAGKKTIGQGGQAKIRKYYSPKFKKTVVEKVIPTNISITASTQAKDIINKINLCKEAVLLFKCDYPNVVRIYDFIEDPVTIVMEYCAKGSLRSILDKDIYLPPLYKIFLIYSICDGLGYIHYKGIVHGDLKCDNILLSDELRYYIGNKYYPIPKLADFGLSQISPNHVAAGTPGYIAPEVFEGSGLNFKTDIFALGMVMFEILSGLRPLPSDLDLAMKLLAAKIPPCTKEVLKIAWEKRDELFLPGINNAYYDAFYTIMIQCIDDDPEKRPDILSLFLIVQKLYKILLAVVEEKTTVIDESESLK